MFQEICWKWHLCQLCSSTYPVSQCGSLAEYLLKAWHLPGTSLWGTPKAGGTVHIFFLDLPCSPSSCLLLFSQYFNKTDDKLCSWVNSFHGQFAWMSGRAVALVFSRLTLICQVASKHICKRNFCSFHKVQIWPRNYLHLDIIEITVFPFRCQASQIFLKVYVHKDITTRYKNSILCFI